MPTLERGRIIRVEVNDPQGRNPKVRPIVVLDCSVSPMIGVAISGEFGSQPELEVELPWNSDPRRVGTQLSKPCAAICNWLVEFRDTQIVDLKGLVPADRLQTIQQKVDSLSE